MMFNEDSRVKIPALLHLTRLGYSYLSLKGAKIDEASNIFPELFSSSLQAINPDATTDDIDRLHKKISLLLGNEDLGKVFYELLTATSGVKLIDFENFDRNSFHVVTELTYKNGDEEFRPDITLLINGMPLAFIEVKKPNNREGVLAERRQVLTEMDLVAFEVLCDAVADYRLARDQRGDRLVTHSSKGSQMLDRLMRWAVFALTN